MAISPRGKVGPSIMDEERERCFVYRERPVYDDPAVRAIIKTMETTSNNGSDGTYYESLDHDYDGYQTENTHKQDVAMTAAKDLVNEMVRNQQYNINLRPVSMSMDTFSCGSPNNSAIEGDLSNGTSEESGVSTSTATTGALSPNTSSTFLDILSSFEVKDMPVVSKPLPQEQRNDTKDLEDADMVDVALSDADADVPELEEDGKPTHVNKAPAEETATSSNNTAKRHRRIRYSHKLALRGHHKKDKTTKPTEVIVSTRESCTSVDSADQKGQPAGSRIIKRCIRRKRSIPGVPRSIIDGGSFSDSDLPSDMESDGDEDDDEHGNKQDRAGARKYYSLRRRNKDDAKHCIVA